jgi:nucleoside-diphosphate-sugar epimerase
MVIGDGQLAKIFTDFSVDRNIIIFASGVSNSNCTDSIAFEREKSLLVHTLEKYKGKKFVYFSSCALSAKNYTQNKYYEHKASIEKYIQIHSREYYIFRLPQLFGKLIAHKTLINHIYQSIIDEHTMTIYNHAYRYVIEINDVQKIVSAYLLYSKSNQIIDIANPYKYSILEIIKIFEDLLEKKAKYTIIDKKDEYNLDLRNILGFIEENHIDILFNKEYLYKHLLNKLKVIKKS